MKALDIGTVYDANMSETAFSIVDGFDLKINSFNLGPEKKC